VRVVSAFKSFIHREGLHNFGREITIYNSSLRVMRDRVHAKVRKVSKREEIKKIIVVIV
jgi:hypothetical protein